MEIVNVLLRTLFFYFFILLCYRIMGKREIGQLSISDLSISILIAELIAISIENKNDSTLMTILPILLLVFLEVIFSILQLKINGLRRVLDGKSSMIIEKGILNIEEMIKQRYSIDDLLLALRGQNIKNIYEIEYALLEPNGKLSIFKKNKLNLVDEYPLPLIVDGTIETTTLKYMNKTKEWLKNRLKENNLNLKNILYAFYRNKKIYVVKKDII